MLTANGQTSASTLDLLAGKTIQSIESSAYYTEQETYAIQITFTDGTTLFLKTGEVHFDQYSSTPIIDFKFNA